MTEQSGFASRGDGGASRRPCGLKSQRNTDNVSLILCGSPPRSATEATAGEPDGALTRELVRPPVPQRVMVDESVTPEA